jgi:hypothetical protein
MDRLFWDLKDDQETFARENTEAWTDRPVFWHSPLDFKSPSIRLVRIIPDPSFDGHIQLEIRHASTKSTYICLSYVWGKERSPQWIRIDGRLFRVGQNLYAFLESARKKPHICTQWLWIDALCIDQSNNSERSHQVQQMGQIFRKAVKVISWFGDDALMARYFRGSMPSLKLNKLSFFEGYLGERRFLDWRFSESEYWKRAWITQEVSLARYITFMAGKEEVDRWQPPAEEEEEDGDEDEDDLVGRWINTPVVIENKAVSLENNSHRWRGRSLIYLLQLFSEKQCHDRRDRVFSLLGLCGEGSDLEVDYDISHDELAKRILQACSNSFCLCAVGILDKVLHLAEPGPAGKEDQLFGILPSRLSELYLGLKKSFLKNSNRTEVGRGVPLHIKIHMDEVCRSYSGRLHMTIDLGTCYRVQHIDNESTLYYNDCDLVIRKSSKRIRSLQGWSISYDRDEEIWDIAFPLATLVQIARVASDVGNEREDPMLYTQGGVADTAVAEAHSKSGLRTPVGVELCTRGKGAHAASVGAHDERALPIHLGRDLYTDAPDLSFPIPDNPVPPPIQNLRSFEIRPYIDDHGRSRSCGVFVYSRKHTKKTSQRLSSMASDNKNASPRSSCMESSRESNFPRNPLVSSISRLLQESQEVQLGHVSSTAR